MVDKDFKDTVSEYIDILVDHCRQTAKELDLPTTEQDMLKIVEHLVKMKIEGVE